MFLKKYFAFYDFFLFTATYLTLKKTQQTKTKNLNNFVETVLQTTALSPKLSLVHSSPKGVFF